MFTKKLFITLLTFVSINMAKSSTQGDSLPTSQDIQLGDGITESMARELLGNVNISMDVLKSILDEKGKEETKISKFKSMFVSGLGFNDRCQYGLSPLHWVLAKFPNLSLVDFLFANKTNVNARTNNGATPLHFAIKYKAGKDVIEKLIANGADLLAIDNNKRSILHCLFCSSYNKDVCYNILEKSNFKHINFIDSFGYTPLTALIRYGGDIGLLQEIVRKHHSKIDFSSQIIPDGSSGIIYNKYSFKRNQTLLSFLDENKFLIINSKKFLMDPFHIGDLFLNEGNKQKAKVYLGAAAERGNGDATIMLAAVYYSLGEKFVGDLLRDRACILGSGKAIWAVACYQYNNQIITCTQAFDMLNSINDGYRSIVDFLKIYVGTTAKVKAASKLLDGSSIGDMDLVAYDRELVVKQLRRGIKLIEIDKINAAVFWLFLSVNSYLSGTSTAPNFMPVQLVYLSFIMSDANIKGFIDILGKAFPGYKSIASSLFYSDNMYRKVGSILMKLKLGVSSINEVNIDGVIESIVAYDGDDQLTDEERGSRDQLKNCLMDMFF